MTNINDGLLHRAFSMFIFDPTTGKLLLQRRAPEKITFPNMWTNTCCSHPLAVRSELDGREGAKRAAQRKLEHELGIPLNEVNLEDIQFLTRIHYLAPSDGLWGEHESTYCATDVSRLYPVPDCAGLAEGQRERGLRREMGFCGRAEATDERPGPYVVKTHTASSFTPWFKLIVNEFLFPWWKELLEHPTSEGKYDAKVLASLENDKIHRL